ncbi:MAG: hypothetical protein EXR58_01885 [Chloroflexi bacterium]|nr:hypothetical protein [Chloroflexota bacterium]
MKIAPLLLGVLMAFAGLACDPGADLLSRPRPPGADAPAVLPTPGVDLNPHRPAGGEVVQIGELHIRGLAQQVYFGNPRFFGEVFNATGRPRGARIHATFWKDGALVQDRSGGPLGYVELAQGATVPFDVLLPEAWDRYQVSVEMVDSDQFASRPGLEMADQVLATTASGDVEISGTVLNSGAGPAARVLLIMAARDADGSLVCAATLYPDAEDLAPGQSAPFSTRIPNYCEWAQVAGYDVSAYASTGH